MLNGAYSSSGCASPGAVQQSPCSLVFIVLRLQFNGSQPDVFAVRIRLKCQRQDTPSVHDIALKNKWSFANRQRTVALLVCICYMKLTGRHRSRLQRDFTCTTYNLDRWCITQFTWHGQSITAFKKKSLVVAWILAVVSCCFKSSGHVFQMRGADRKCSHANCTFCSWHEEVAICWRS